MVSKVCVCYAYKHLSSTDQQYGDAPPFRGTKTVEGNSFGSFSFGERTRSVTDRLLRCSSNNLDLQYKDYSNLGIEIQVGARMKSLFDFFVCSSADAEELKLSLFITDKITERVFIRFIQTDDLILFIE